MSSPVVSGGRFFAVQTSSQAATLIIVGSGSRIAIGCWQTAGEQARPDKRGKLQPADQITSPPAALWAVAKHPRQWLRQVQGTESQYYRAVGSAEALMLKAKELKEHWMKGVGGERARQLLAQQNE